MGSKFCNLNVYGEDLAAVESLCPGCAVRSISRNWITVAAEDLEFGFTPKEAKRLSKVLPHPVLSTEYFDDDYVEFALYSGGKRVARHIPAEYEGFLRSPGKSKVWAEQLGLSQEAEKTLRTVFKETNPEAALRLMECVLNCPLWVDAEFIDSVSEPTQEYLTEYLERKKAEKKIKNQTKLVLLDEVEGDFGESWRIDHPAIKNEHTDAIKSFWDIRDGALRKLFEKRFPDGVSVLARGEGMVLLTLEQISGERIKKIPCVLSDKGEVLETICADEIQLSHGAFLDRERVFLEGGCWNIRTHRKEWDIGIERTFYGIRPPCRLDSGRLAVVYDVKGNPLDSYLESFYPDGSGRNVLALPTHRHWGYPIAFQNEFLMACGSTLSGYDLSLKEIWSVDLGEDVGQLGEPLLDDETNTLYMSTYCRITAFDLETRQIKAIRNVADGEDCFLYDVLPGVGPVMLTGNSSIQVWNSELTPISRHRVKGMLGRVVHQDGKVYILTNTRRESELTKTEKGWSHVETKPGCLRLYELKV